MAEAGEFASHETSTCAGFHDDAAGMARGEKLEHLFAAAFSARARPYHVAPGRER